MINKRNKLYIESENRNRVVDYIFDEICNSINNEESIFVIDRNHKYQNKINDKLVDKEYNIINIDLTNLNNSNSFNPYLIPYKLYNNGNIDAAIDLVKSINNYIIKSDNLNSDPFWENSALDIFTASTLYLFETETNENNINLKNIYKLFRNLSENVDDFKEKINCSKEYIKILASPYVLAPIETRKSIYSVCSQKVNLYIMQPLLCDFLSKSSFDLIKELNSKFAIIINVVDGKSYKNIIANIMIDDINYIVDDEKKITFYIEDVTDLKFINVLYNMIKRTSESIKIVMSASSRETFDKVYTDYIELLEIINN